MAQLEFKLPDIGEGIAEGEIVKWLVAVGDSVAEHQPVVEVMTDKATVEIPAPQAGVVQEIRAKEGDVVPVGEVLFVLGEAGGAAPKTPAQEPKQTKAAQPEQTKAEQPKQPEPEASVVPAPRSTPSKAGKAPAKAAPPSGGGEVLAFKLPDIGEGIAEGEIVQWLVKEGDSVEEHQPVVEVMTDKATVEIPAPAAGVVAALKAKAGDVVPIGTVIFELRRGAAPAGQPQAEPKRAEPQRAAPAAPRPAAAAVGAGSRTGAGTAVARASTATDTGNGRVRAVPSARRVARELGIDLTQVPGTGRGGIVRRADVEAFHRSGAAAATAPQAPAAPAPAAPTAAARKPAAPPVALSVGERETRKPFRGVRRKIAEAMSRSMFTATHFTVVEELDVTELVEVRARAKEIGARDGIKVTYMPFIMKACASALFRFPELNSQLDESTQEIVTYHFVNLGIATDTEQGLIVPVVRDVQSKGMLQLAYELQELAERTRSGKIKPDELQGGTFTITNAGNIGGTLATPIINFPEVGILGVHRIVKRPGIVETPEGDEMAVRQYMNLSISVDHRLVDGASAVRFLVHVKELLEHPGLLAL